MNIQSSHSLYIILNENGTLYVDNNKDYRLYKTKEGLQKYKQKYRGKKIAVFTLDDVMDIDELFIK